MSDKPKIEVINDAEMAFYDMLLVSFSESMQEIDKLKAERVQWVALAKLGRWCLDQAANITQSKFSIEDADAIDAKAVALGLGRMEDMETYELFIETDLAKLPIAARVRSMI